METQVSVLFGPSNHSALIQRHNNWIAIWLFIVAAMIFIIVILGGATRLTHSGLSMVDWKPITGWLPPFAESEWQAVFERYKTSPEYREVNQDMSLAGFKGIFWLEFLHRLWGRIIGVAFFLPFAVFLIKGWVRGRLAGWLAGIFVLGGLQGGMGWFMVKSGLVDQPDVSQYRLAAHLCLALLIYALTLWVAIGLARQPNANGMNAAGGLAKAAAGLLALISVTIFSGALVAGLDAGFSYNTFPLMDGDLVPDGLFEQVPYYLNFFENRITVQFEHRLLAEITLVCVLVFWWIARRRELSDMARQAIRAIAVMAVLQVILGIATLVLVVPLSLGVMHQGGAVVLLGITIWVFWELTQGAG